MNKIYLIGIFSIFLFACSSETKKESQSDIDINNFKKEALALTKDANQLILRENTLAELIFSGAPEEINEYYIKEKLMYFNIEVIKDEGFDERGSTIYYTGWKAGTPIFTLNLMENVPNTVKNLYIQYSGVIDEYGIKNKMTYQQAKLLRPNLKLEISKVDNQLLLVEEMSNINYILCCPSEVKLEYTDIELNQLTIQSILWSSDLEDL